MEYVYEHVLECSSTAPWRWCLSPAVLSYRRHSPLLSTCVQKKRRARIDQQDKMWTALFTAFLPLLVLARDCPPIQSCSKVALKKGSDPCCVPSPSGLFVFRQRFEPDVGGDMGSWGIDGLDVLEYVTTSLTSLPEGRDFS